MSKPEPDKPYGWVLILRGLARAAIMLKDHPSALRVLCVAAEYMRQNGVSRVGQDTIAAQLDMTRQGVNKHLAQLDRMNILCNADDRDGILKSYHLDMEGLDDERFGQKRVDARRAAKRAAKKGKFDPANIEPKEKGAEPTAPIQEPPEPKSFKNAEAVSIVNRWMVGAIAKHQTFGRGVIETVDGTTLTVNFASGQKRVRLDSVTVHVGPQNTKGAT